MTQLLIRALRRGFANFALMFLLIWLCAGVLCMVMLGQFVGGRYPLTESITVTYFSLFMDMLPLAILFGLVAFVVGLFVFSPRWRYGAVAVIFCFGMYESGAYEAFLFQLNGGTTWAVGEAFWAYIWHPIIYPAVNLFGLVVIACVFALGRRFKA